MPLLGAVQTPTALSSGERIAVLNAENLSSGALTMAVSLHPQANAPIMLSLYNNSGQTVTLQGSPDLVQADFMPVSSGAQAISVANGAVGTFEVSSGLYYAVKAGGAITAGTIWLAR
jgi:hypothetical protein